jgi:transcriptional regulator with GAF, ATPase, and Fis domain
VVELLAARTAGAESPALVASVLEALEATLPRGYAWPGNVRELEQAVRRILLTGRYAADLARDTQAGTNFEALLAEGRLTADEMLARYCAMLYQRLGSYAAVAERTGLDPRTSRKYILAAKSG